MSDYDYSKFGVWDTNSGSYYNPSSPPYCSPFVQVACCTNPLPPLLGTLATSPVSSLSFLSYSPHTSLLPLPEGLGIVPSLSSPKSLSGLPPLKPSLLPPPLWRNTLLSTLLSLLVPPRPHLLSLPPLSFSTLLWPLTPHCPSLSTWSPLSPALHCTQSFTSHPCPLLSGLAPCVMLDWASA